MDGGATKSKNRHGRNCGVFLTVNLGAPPGLSNVCQRAINLLNPVPLRFCNSLLLTERSCSNIGRYTSQIPKFPESFFESRLFKPKTARPGASAHCQFLLWAFAKVECLMKSRCEFLDRACVEAYECFNMSVEIN